jgi:hypothetical protein
MNQKLRAISRVSGMLAVIGLGVLLLKLAITYISVEAVPYVIAFALLAVSVYFLYSIALAQIKYEDQLKSMVDKK